MLRRWNSTLLLLATLLCSAPLLAASYTKLLLIGDSLSDTGNLYALTSSFGFPTPPPPYSNGRFSNGQVYAEYLSDSLGLGAVTPSLLGGNNYAYGGALVSDAVPSFIPSLPAQHNTLIAKSGGALDAGALYVVWGGNNDLFGLLDQSLTDSVAQGLINNVADTLVSTIANLVTHGAQHLLVPNIPDLGLTPREAANATNATQYSQWFNSRLSSGLATIQGADILLFDTFTTLQQLAPGFANSTGGCLLLAVSCDGFLFADDVHPTTAAHKLLAERMHAKLTAVPLPAGVWLLGSGLMLLAVRRRSH